VNDLSCWILYSNPDEFRLINWLQDFNWVADNNLIDGWYIEAYTGDVQPGDTVFIWTGVDKEKTSGIYSEGKIVPAPQEFPLTKYEGQYFNNPEVMNSVTGFDTLAVKYSRLCLGVPLLKDEIEAHDILRSIMAGSGRHGRIQPISEEACTTIARMLRGRTNMVDIQYCRT
jgi:hypothetical protein